MPQPWKNRRGMFVQLILISFLFRYSLMIRTNTLEICQKRTLCPKKNESCHPVVMKCQNDSCRYRRFYTNDHRHLAFSRWFYDPYYQRCRRYNHHIENFVYFRLLRDCRRVCPVIRRKRNEYIVTLHVSESPVNYNDTIYVQLQIDLSPTWTQKLTDSMNVSTQTYNSQVHYFQNYRRRFANFVDPMYQLMLDQQRNSKKQNY